MSSGRDTPGADRQESGPNAAAEGDETPRLEPRADEEPESTPSTVTLTSAELKNLLSSIQALAQQAARPSPEPERSYEAKLQGPDVFTGDRSKLRSFLGGCQTVFEGQPKHYKTDHSRIFYIADRLGGAPREWWMTIMLQKESDRPDFIKDYSLFKTQLQDRFGDPEWRTKAEREILTLKMKNSAAVYSTQFQGLVEQLEWDLNAAPVLALFYHGLTSFIKDELAHGYDERPKTTALLIQRALYIDGRFVGRADERRYEQGYQASSRGPRNRGNQTSPADKDGQSSPSPATTSAAGRKGDPKYTGPNGKDGKWRAFTLTPEGKVPSSEAKLREKNGECRRCGAPDHKASECPESGKAKGAQ
jgi:hypothetical protein